MGKGGFAEWAQYQGLGAGAALICGGPLTFFYPLWYLGPFGLILGAIVLLLEWPVAGVPGVLGAAYAKYWVRGLLYVLLSGPCYLQAALLNGGMFLSCCGLTYLFAHSQGEEYKPPRGRGGGGGKVAPPPRAQGEKR
ncbi:hypothetical protein H9P43_005978 [Blastocladiella emersonii ATCC 22665]|nr:hypothetical protein H9P43_005978 [Blastocladiella emersonii ATCC 22665]